MPEEMYALSRLDETFDRTKSLLWPPLRGVWLRLTVIALFVGGSLDLLSNFDPYLVVSFVLGSIISVMPPIVAVALVGIALLWWIIGTVLQFVFVDMLSTGDIRIRRFFRERLGKGVRLFLFQVALTLLPALAGIAFLVALLGFGRGGGSVPSIPFYVFIPVMMGVTFLFRIILLLTTDFVVPIMIREDCGAIKGWKRMIGMISAKFLQIVVYVVGRLTLGFIAGIVCTILIALALVVTAIPFVLIGTAMFGPFQTGNYMSFLPLLVPYLIIAIPVVLLIMVPFVTFFRYYGLLVLEGLAPEYRLLPE